MTPPHARKQGARDRPRRVLFRGPPSRPLLRVRLHCTCLVLLFVLVCRAGEVSFRRPVCALPVGPTLTRAYRCVGAHAHYNIPTISYQCEH